MIEPLESRTLLSHGTPVVAASLALPATVAPLHASVTSITDPTFNVVAGTSFTRQLGFYASSVGNGTNLTASIDWGDGTTSSVVPLFDATQTPAGYAVVGSHTYASAGQFAIQAQLIDRPIPQPGQPTPLFIAILETFYATAVVTPAQTTVPPAPTITETAGQKFAATLGTFSTIAPATHLSATIHWGDGKTSSGKLTATGVAGIDVINFSVAGAHRYARAGTFAIEVVVRRRVGLGKPLLIDTLDSTATVNASATL